MEGLQRLERIGRGTFAEVFKAVDETGFVAVKVIPLDGLTHDIDEIQEEIRLLSRCEHPNIIRYHRTLIDKNKLLVVMDYCEVGSLRDIIEQLGPVPERAATFIGREVLHALSYLHDQSIVHRDIKAANVLLSADGQVRLGDFGVSTQTGPGPLKLAGSPYWMPPEVIRRTRFDAKADIWSFGITMFELLTGNPPLWQVDPAKAMRTIARSMPPRLESNTVSRERPTAKELLRCKAFKHVKPGSLNDLISRFLVLSQQQDDHQSLLSRVTNVRSEIADDFWNFSEQELPQDPLLEKYFGGDTDEGLEALQVLPSTAGPKLPDKPAVGHKRTESQSSTGLSVGSNSLLDSELDLTVAIDARMATALDAMQLGETCSDPKGAQILTLSVKDAEPSSNDDGRVKVFPQMHFRSLCREDKLRAKELLFKIKDLEEDITAAVPILGADEKKKYLGAQQAKLAALRQFMCEAELLLCSKVID